MYEEIEREAGPSARMTLALEKTYGEVDRSLRGLLEDGSCRRTADMAVLAATSRGLEAVFNGEWQAPAAGLAQKSLERQLQQAKDEAAALKARMEMEAEARVAAGERLTALEKELADVKEDYANLKAIQERESPS